MPQQLQKYNEKATGKKLLTREEYTKLPEESDIRKQKAENLKERLELEQL